MEKHFNAGNVFGRVVDDIKRETSRSGGEYISFTVNVSGRRCGSARAYCRMWKPERFEPFLACLKKDPEAAFWFRGFFGQYWTERNEVMSNFTFYQWEPRDSEPRAAFILKGRVDQAQEVKSGQRILLKVERDGQQEETFELWSQAEKFLDEPGPGDLVEAKGYLRQETPEDDFGGSSGPVRAYIEQLRIL